jgi:hypothetical protein
MNQQNEYYLYSHTTESPLQIQCNPHQNNNDILYRTRENKPKIHVEAKKKKTKNKKKTQIAKENQSKKNNARDITISDFKIYYNHSDKNSMVTQK